MSKKGMVVAFNSIVWIRGKRPSRFSETVSLCFQFHCMDSYRNPTVHHHHGVHLFQFHCMDSGLISYRNPTWPHKPFNSIVWIHSMWAGVVGCEVSGFFQFHCMDSTKDNNRGKVILAPVSFNSIVWIRCTSGPSTS